METTRALVLVDWDTSRRIANGGVAEKHRKIAVEIGEAISLFETHILDVVSTNKGIVKVFWRIYHGWHQGHSPTKDRLEFDKFILEYDWHRVNNTVFEKNFAYGDNLFCNSRRLLLRNTFRDDLVDKPSRQKMVDTGFTADLVTASIIKGYQYLIVVGNDNDLIPEIIVSESWGANVRYLRVGHGTKLPLLGNKGRDFPVTNIVGGGV